MSLITSDPTRTVGETPTPTGSAWLDFGPRWSVAVRSLAGTTDGAKENQDNYLLIDTRGQPAHLLGQREVRPAAIPNWPAGHARIAILDGMGGHGQGREVAEAVVQALLTVPAMPDLASLCAQLDAVHDELHGRFASAAGMGAPVPGTTLILLEMPATGPALLYHVGDSRLFEITSERWHPLTIDHVPATGHLLRQHLEEADWRRQVYETCGSEIAQAFVLGGNLIEGPVDAALTPLTSRLLPPCLSGLEDRRVVELAPGTLLVMATDGLWASPAPLPWLNRWPSILCRPERPLPMLVDDLFTEFILNPPDDLQGDNCTVLALRVAP